MDWLTEFTTPQSACGRQLPLRRGALLAVIQLVNGHYALATVKFGELYENRT